MNGKGERRRADHFEYMTRWSGGEGFVYHKRGNVDGDGEMFCRGLFGMRDMPSRSSPSPILADPQISIWITKAVDEEAILTK